MSTLVDSSVLLDIMAGSAWREWSEQQLARLLSEGEVAINQVVYAEVAVGFVTQQRLERALQSVGIKRIALPWASAWRVARAFAEYRRAGGSRTLPLPDFFIGAHAEVAGLRLLTRDPARVRTYFPAVALIAP